MFLTIQNGDYTINLSMICDVEWTKDGATITMANATTYDLDEKVDLAALKKAVGYKS
jgi:hypothetical protein